MFYLTVYINLLNNFFVDLIIATNILSISLEYIKCYFTKKSVLGKGKKSKGFLKGFNHDCS